MMEGGVRFQRLLCVTDNPVREGRRQTSFPRMNGRCWLLRGQECPRHTVLCDAGFRVGPVDLAQGVADFAYGCVGADGVDNVGHGIAG
jgi:hypothetical protein